MLVTYKGIQFDKKDLVIEVSRYADGDIYYYVVARYGIRGYVVFLATRDLHEAFALYDEIYNGDKG